MKEDFSALDVGKWRQAMEEELHGLREKGRFKGEEPQSNIKSIKMRLRYKLKHGSDGEIERYTAPLVERGFSQRPGVDFVETISPVIGFDVVRTVLAISALQGGTLRTLDFKQAY